MADKTGVEVIAQAQDDGILNTEPAMVRGAVISIVGAIGTVLVVSGILTEEQRAALQDNAGAIAAAAVIILPILQSIWTRLAVYSPRSAAEIAVVNAAQMPGQPTLDVS